MYNFYQSTIRKAINKDVTNKPVGDVLLFGKECQYIIRKKKKRGISMNRIQILGIDNILGHTYTQRKNELSPLVKQHNPIFIQIGSVDILSSYTRSDLKDREIIATARANHNEMTDILKKKGFYPSIKENLPPSTYIINLLLDWEIHISGQHNTKIKKAKKHTITICEATREEFDICYKILQQTGQEKGFGIISYISFCNLVDYFSIHSTGSIYIAKIENKIVAMAIYIKDYAHKTAVYLYGGTDREYANRGASHLLHIEVFKTLQKEGFHQVDLLGGGPTGFPEHPLSSVSIFKEGFGGQKYDYIGSFDIVYKPLIYRIRTTLRGLFH